MCISLRSSATLGNTGLIKEAQTKGKTDDNFVNINAPKKELLADLQGAVSSNNQGKLFLTHLSGGKTVTDVIDMTKPENKKAINAMISELKAGIDKPDFKLSTINFESAPTNPTGVTTKSAPSSKGFIEMKVNDFEKKAAGDAKSGKDEQFNKLYEFPQNYITYDSKTGDITGSQLVKEGETSKSDGKLITSKSESIVPETNMKDLIMNDFKKYAEPPLTKTFPDTPEGVGKFMEALKNIPGNANNTGITKEKAEDLLKYIHTGANSEGNVNVKELQTLLNGLTGKAGVDINGKNNPAGGDDQYGFATTLQVRSLAAIIPKDILSGNPIILIDTSASMDKELKELTTTLGKVINNENKYSIGRFGDTGRIGEKTAGKTETFGNDMQWKTDGNGKTEGNTPVDGTTAMNALKNMAGTSAGSNESGIRGGLLALKDVAKNPSSSPENLLLFTDEGDRGLSDLGNLILAGRDKGYKPVIIYHNDTSNKYAAIDLSTIHQKVKEYNESNPTKPITLTGSFKNGEYDIDWRLVISTLNIPMADDIKSLKI